MRNKLFLIIFILIFSALFTNLALGQTPATDKALELQYPEVPGTKAPTTVKVPLPEYVRYVIYLVIGIAGLLALSVLVIGGIKYLSSAGNIAQATDAKSQIFAGVIGLLVLLGSVIILNTLSPQLTEITLEPLKPIKMSLPPGIWLCTLRVPLNDWEGADGPRRANLIKSLKQNCWQATYAGDIPKEFQWRKEIGPDAILPIRTVPTEGAIGVWFIPKLIPPELQQEQDPSFFSVVVYEKEKLKGNAEFIEPERHRAATAGMPNPYPSWRSFRLDSSKVKEPMSVIPLQYLSRPNPEWEVIVYEDIQYNEESDHNPKEYPCKGVTNYYSIYCDFKGEVDVGSIDIEGELIALLRNDNKNKIDVYSQDNPNLRDNPAGMWCVGIGSTGILHHACATGVSILAAKVIGS